MENKKDKIDQSNSQKIFFTIILVMFGWIFYQSFKQKIGGTYKKWHSFYGNTISEEVIRKYRGNIPLSEYKSFSEDQIDNYCNIIHFKKYPIVEECKKIGLVISDEVAQRVIVNKREFLSEDGIFNYAKFKECLDNWKISESDYYDLIKEDLLIKQYFYFLKNSYIIPKKILDRFTRQYNKVLRIKYGFVDHSVVKSRIRDIIHCSEEILRKFYLDNKKKFSDIELAKYELYSIDNVKENYILLNFYMKHKMKDELLKVFNGKTCDISYVEDKNTSDSIEYYLDRTNKRDTFILLKSTNEKFYLLFISEPKKLIEKSFEDISIEDLKYEYILSEVLKNVDSTFVDNWLFKDISPDLYIIPGIPTNFVQLMFSAKINEEKIFQDKSRTYFLTVEHVSSKENILENDNDLKLKLDNLLIEAVESYLNNKYLNEKGN